MEDIDYSANFYSERTSGIIAEHATRKPSQPLWLHYTIQNVHAPYTLPPAWEVNAYPDYRPAAGKPPAAAAQDHILGNMLNMLDSAMGNLTRSLKTARLWEDALIVFSAVSCAQSPFGCVGAHAPLRAMPGQRRHWARQQPPFAWPQARPVRRRDARDRLHLWRLCAAGAPGHRIGRRVRPCRGLV